MHIDSRGVCIHYIYTHLNEVCCQYIFYILGFLSSNFSNFKKSLNSFTKQQSRKSLNMALFSNVNRFYFGTLAVGMVMDVSMN